MNLVIINHKFHYEIEKLLRVFFPSAKITVTDSRNDEESFVITELKKSEAEAEIKITASLFGNETVRSEVFSAKDKDFGEADDSYYERKMAIMLFEMLKEITGYIPPWGILTGVRPAKLMSKLSKDYGEETAADYFVNELKCSKEKTALALAVAKKEEPITNSSKPESFSLYVSIPFCPSRCSYCSFVSHSNEHAKKLIPKYVELLCSEIEETAKIAKETNLKLESIYIGGGTPTALEAEDIRKITDAISRSFDIPEGTEYTIEAGRPDSVTDAKLDVIIQSGANRISINPQTFNDSVLNEIGRRHTGQMTEDAMLMARRHGFDNINMDLIAGLPTDTLESFKYSLNKTLSFSPENITVHTLALKRSSTLVTEKLEKGDVEQVGAMLDFAFETLTGNGYEPYYMYRQSNCLGNLENVGWAKKDLECKYNVYMMEECHTVLAVGAGGVTKLRSPFSNEIERIFNYKYPYEYIDKFDEILNRKKRIPEFYSEVFSSSEG